MVRKRYERKCQFMLFRKNSFGADLSSGAHTSSSDPNIDIKISGSDKGFVLEVSIDKVGIHWGHFHVLVVEHCTLPLAYFFKEKLAGCFFLFLAHTGGFNPVVQIYSQLNLT